MSAKAVSPVAQARLNTLMAKIVQQAENDSALSDATMRASELVHPAVVLEMLKLTDGELAAKGWTRQELIVASHAILPFQHMPAYLRMAHERHIARIRARGDRSEAPGSQGYVIPVPQGERKEIEKKTEEDE